MTTIFRVMTRLRRPIPWQLDGYFLFRSHHGSASEVEPDEACSDTLVIEEVDGRDGPCVDSLATLMGAAGDASDGDAVDARLANHNRCFVARDGERVIGMRWIACPGSPFFRGFAELVKDQPAARVFNRAYVHADYRGRRLQQRLDRVMKRQLAAEGIRTTFVFVGVYNFASIRNCLRCNDQVRLIYHARFDLPFLRPINRYPRLDDEPWKPCEQVLRGM